MAVFHYSLKMFFRSRCRIGQARLFSADAPPTVETSQENAASISQQNNQVGNFSKSPSALENISSPPPWENPWIWAFGPPQSPPKFTKTVESNEEFKWVSRLKPIETVPEMPKHETYPTPSGWRPPKNPPPDLPYSIRRTNLHLFPLFLQCRRDDLDPKTMEYNYAELVILRNVEGDIFACEEDLSAYLEHKLGRKVATHVNELHGKISVRGADRSHLEQFLMEKGF